MKPVLFFNCFTAILLLSSCDKPKVLLRERAVLEAEILRSNEELHSLEAQFTVLQQGPISYGMTPEVYHEQVVKKNMAAQDQVAALEKVCNLGEASLSELRPRVDSYKAKYLR